MHIENYEKQDMLRKARSKKELYDDFISSNKKIGDMVKKSR